MKESKRVKSLGGFLNWSAQFNDGQYLFRGVTRDCYEIEASACRRLPDSERTNPERLLRINQQLIERARLLGHDQRNGQRLNDLELLAELQHFGAATCLIDFSRSALTALWFACQRSSTAKDENGKVFAVRADDSARAISITPDLMTDRRIDYFFVEDDHGRHRTYQWQPRYQNNRIVAQQSVFIFGGAQIEKEAECIILKSQKSEILKSLDKVSGITEASIFPDFYGFARLHAHDKRYIEPDVQGSLQRGVEAHQRGNLDNAIEYYDEVISILDPEGDS